MIDAPNLLIPKMGHEAEFFVATDASYKVGIAGVLLQEDTSGSLRPCAYWARKLKDCETRYSAYEPLLRFCPVYGECIYLDVKISQ
jgi:hypothetical protein